LNLGIIQDKDEQEMSRLFDSYMENNTRRKATNNNPKKVKSTPPIQQNPDSLQKKHFDEKINGDSIKNPEDTFQNVLDVFENIQKKFKPVINKVEIINPKISNEQVENPTIELPFKNNTFNKTRPIETIFNNDESTEAIISEDSFTTISSVEFQTPILSLNGLNDTVLLRGAVKAINNSNREKANGTRPQNKILLVDDDLFLRKALALYLKNKGYEVVQVSDGEEAMDKINKNWFNLIITEMNLPTFGGMELINEIRNKLKLRIPIIVLTTFGVANVEVEMLTLGANDFLSKPFSPEVLKARIERALVEK